jgi:hypothetical protein
VAEHKEVPNEKAALEIIGVLEDRYGDLHLDVGRLRQPIKWTQGGGGSRQQLATARGRVTRRAIPAPHKGHGRQGPGKDNVAQGTPKGRMFGKRREARSECNNGIRNRDVRQQLRLGSKGNVNETFRESSGWRSQRE